MSNDQSLKNDNETQSEQDNWPHCYINYIPPNSSSSDPGFFVQINCDNELALAKKGNIKDFADCKDVYN